MSLLGDVTIEQVEEDIQKCEDFLHQEKLCSSSPGSFSALVRSPSSRPSQRWKKDASKRVGSAEAFQEVERQNRKAALSQAGNHSDGLKASISQVHPKLHQAWGDQSEVGHEKVGNAQQEEEEEEKTTNRMSAEQRVRVQKLLKERRSRLGICGTEGKLDIPHSSVDFLSPESSISRVPSACHSPPSASYTSSSMMSSDTHRLDFGGTHSENLHNKSRLCKVPWHGTSKSHSAGLDIDSRASGECTVTLVSHGNEGVDTVTKGGSLGDDRYMHGPQEVDPAIWSEPLDRQRSESTDATHTSGATPGTVELAVCEAIRRVDRGRRMRSTGVAKGFKLSYMSNRVSRHSKEAIKERIELEQSKDLTFRPTFVARSRSMPRSYPLNRSERLKQLSQPKTELWQRCEREKAEKSVSTLKQCSFKPCTGRGPDLLIDHGHLPVEDRLFHAHDDRKTVRARLKIQQEVLELSECTFKPVTNTHRRTPKKYRPIQDRIMEMQQKKKEKVMLGKAANPDFTFVPAVNPRSVRLATAKEMRELKEDTCFADRLSGNNMCHFYKRKAQNAGCYSEENECTFAPLINPVSRIMVDNAEVPQTFLERQEHFIDKKRHQEARRQVASEDKECTFHPATGNIDDILAASTLSGRLTETAEDRTERLAFKDAESRECNRDALSKQLFSQYTFQPEINPVSKKIGKYKTVEELHKSKSRRSIQKAKQADQLRFSQECTFRPAKISRDRSERPRSAPHVSRERGAPDGLLHRVQQQQERKQKRIEHMRVQNKKKEFEQCTFRPELLPGGQNSKRPIVINGLGRHIELQQLAARLKEDQARREAKAFLTRPSSPATQFTVPEPFHLSETRQKEKGVFRRKKLKEELLEKTMKECTFHPKTNVKETREILWRILHTDIASGSLSQKQIVLSSQ